MILSIVDRYNYSFINYEQQFEQIFCMYLDTYFSAMESTSQSAVNDSLYDAKFVKYAT